MKNETKDQMWATRAVATFLRCCALLAAREFERCGAQDLAAAKRIRRAVKL